MIKKLILLSIFVLSGCSNIETNTRFFVIGNTSNNLGFDEFGIDLSLEQRIKSGPIMFKVDGMYSPTLKQNAVKGFQYSSGVGTRYYFGEHINKISDGFFVEPGYWWSGYSMKFSDGTKWKKDANNFKFSAGWDKDNWEIVLGGSPREKQTPNELSYIDGKVEYEFAENWIVLMELKCISYNQDTERKTGFMEFLGIGYSF